MHIENSPWVVLAFALFFIPDPSLLFFFYEWVECSAIRGVWEVGMV